MVEKNERGQRKVNTPGKEKRFVRTYAHVPSYSSALKSNPQTAKAG
jgi:hypothetical protein